MRTIWTRAVVVSAMLVAAAVTASPRIARADDVTPGTTTLATTTIVGRPARPGVTVVLTRPTAAREAGAAHEAVRRALVEASMPSTLRR